MSIKVMTWVWDNAELSGAELLLLLAIADHCNDDGECYPSVARLAKKARLSESHAQTLIRKMKDAKDISVVLNAGIETGRGATNRYYVNGYRQHMSLPHIDSTKTIRKPDELKKPKKKSWGIADSTPIADSTATGIADNASGVLQTVPKPSVEPSVEPIADYAALPASNGRIIKEKVANPYYDAIKDILGLHGGQNGDMQKMLMGISKKNGYAAYNLSPAMDILDFIEWGKWAKKKLGQFMVKSPAKVNGYITEWREMGSPKADEPKPTKPTGSMNAARAMAMLNQAQYEDSKNGND